MTLKKPQGFPRVHGPLFENLRARNLMNSKLILKYIEVNDYSDYSWVMCEIIMNWKYNLLEL